MLVDGDRAFVRYAGFRDAQSVDDRCYEILSQSAASWLKDSRTGAVAGLGRHGAQGELRATFRVALAGLASTDATHVALRAIPERLPADGSSAASDPDVVSSTPTLQPTDDGLATLIDVAVPVSELLARGARENGPSRWTWRSREHTTSCRCPRRRRFLRPTAGIGGAPFRMSSRATKAGRLQLLVQPISRREAVGRRLRSLVSRAGRD